MDGCCRLIGSFNVTQSINRLVQIRKLLRFAKERSFARFDDLDLQNARFTTAGILLATKSTRGSTRVFATLTDGRDQIQLVFTPGQSGISTEQLASLQRGSRVSVTGVPFLSGRTEATAIASLYVVELQTSFPPAPVKFDEEGLQREVTPRLLIGHLMAFVSQHLEDAGYRRYEPRFITSSHVDLETEPLMVRFPGRGADLFLEVSPLPQLLFAAVMTGQRRLYSPTRLFSRAYRDGFTSPDSPIVAAVEVEMGKAPRLSLDEITSLLVAGFNKAHERGLPFDAVPESNANVGNLTSTSDDSGAARMSVRRIDLTVPQTTSYAYDIRRRIEVEAPSGQVIIEGHEGLIANAMPYTWLCTHVERLAMGDFWRITQRRGPETGLG